MRHSYVLINLEPGSEEESLILARMVPSTGWPMTPLLAFVDLFVDSSNLEDVTRTLSQLPSVVELYEVRGEFDIVALVSADGVKEFRDILDNKILKIKGVKNQITSVVLNTDEGPSDSNVRATSS